MIARDVEVSAVLPSVDLDHELRPEARELDDERPDRNLPAEVEPLRP